MVISKKLHVSSDFFINNHNAIFDDGFYSLFYENSQNIFFITDAHYKIIDCNKYMSDYLGFSKDELMSLPTCLDLLTTLSKEYGLTLMSTYMNKGAIKDIEFQVKKKNGDIIYVAVNAIAVFDKNVQPIYNLVTWHDVTELVNARKIILDQGRDLSLKYQELELRNEELNTFSHVMIHDLKAPLRSINFLAQQIATDNDNKLSKTSSELMSQFRNKLKKIDSLINEIFSYFFKSSEINQNESFASEEFFKNIISNVNIPNGFQIHFQNIPEHLTTQRLPLQQVFTNLISNAINHHHNPDKGLIKIHCKENNKGYEFQVIDNGPGISEDYIDIIFKPLIRLQANSHVEGTGLGLAIVDRIIKHQQGKIYVSSQLGIGSTFTFTWPTQVSFL